MHIDPIDDVVSVEHWPSRQAAKGEIPHQFSEKVASRVVSSELSAALLWLMLVAAHRAVHGQTVDTPTFGSIPRSSPADWTQFHRDNMQRWNPYKHLLDVDTVSSLKLKWSFPEGIQGKDEYSFSSPIVVNGILYFSAYDGTLFALNADTGEKLWSKLVGAGSTPAVSDGMLFVGGLDSVVHALNAVTGKASLLASSA